MIGGWITVPGRVPEQNHQAQNHHLEEWQKKNISLCWFTFQEMRRPVENKGVIIQSNVT